VSNVSLDSVGRPDKNWAGNIAFAAPDFYRPAAVSELRAVIARARQVRVLATGHSFNDMADSPGAQVSLAGLPPEVWCARPHWGKIFTTSAEDLASSYDRLPDFLDLTRHYDSAGKFRNAYTARYLGR